MNNHHHKTDFENLRVTQLERIYNGVNHKVELLQEKLAADMGRTSFYDILPRNFSIIPEIHQCSLHDLKELEELTAKRFDVYWAMEHKKAAAKGTLEKYYAEFKYYSLRDTLNDDEINELFTRIETYCNQRMTSHKIITCIMEAPNFLEEVMA